MKMLFAMLALILLCSMTLPAQTDPVETDKIYLLDGKVLEGKVNLIKNDVVQFTDKETEIQYEINKTDIKVIVLASGKPIMLDEVKVEETPPVPPVATTVAPVVVETETEQSTMETPIEEVPEIQFSLAGYLAGSIQNWSVETEESTIGFGLAGNLFAGIIWEEMYFGLGPHFGGSWWTVNESIMGYSVSATTSVSDFGLDLAAAWDGFFMTIGWGSGSVSITASVEGESQTIDIPEAIGYTRLVIGFYDGWMFGLAFMNYDDDVIENNLNRAEIMLGWAF